MLGSRVRAPKGAPKTPFYATLWHTGARKGARFLTNLAPFPYYGGKVSRMPEIVFVPFYLFYAKYSIALSESCTDLLAMYLSVICVDECPIIPAN